MTADPDRKRTELPLVDPAANDPPAAAAPGDPRPSRRTELLRAAADDELTAADRAELQDHLARHPEDQGIIDFERSLRAAVARTAAEEATPELRRRIAGMRTAIPDGAAVPALRDRRPLRFALAALVVLAVGAGLWSWIAVRAARGPLLPGSTALTPVSLRDAVASFVNSQHRFCELHADVVASGFRMASPQTMTDVLAELLGSAPELSELRQSGVKIVGVNECAVPGGGRSAHIVLDITPVAGPEGVDGCSLVSLFIQNDHGQLNIEPGKTYRMTPKSQPGGSAYSEIYVWRKDGQLYFLASSSQVSLDQARIAAGVRQAEGSI